MGRRQRDRILGPYLRPDGCWQVFHVIGGVRKSVRLPEGTSRSEAEQAAEDARSMLESPDVVWTVAYAVAEYQKVVTSRNSAATAAFAGFALSPLVAAHPDLLVARLGPSHLDQFLEAIESKSMATVQSYWKVLVRFEAWLRRRSLLDREVVAAFLRRRERLDQPLPWLTKAGSRLLNHGRPQLRGTAEVSAYLAAALTETHTHCTSIAQRARVAAERRVASALPLLCGLASGEVLHLRVADVDLVSGIGFVRDDEARASNDDWHPKTANRTGEFGIPDVLRSDLEFLCRDRAPGDLVFARPDGKPHIRSWLEGLVADVCSRAAVNGQPVRVVCPHGLRGTYATLLRVLASQHVVDIARALRHGDHGQTATRHYIGAPERRVALRVVVGNGSEETGS